MMNVIRQGMRSRNSAKLLEYETKALRINLTTPSMKPILLTTLISAAGLLIPASLIAAGASENWTEHCAKCHAADGTGKTKMGAKLKIRDLTSPEVQATFTDEKAFDGIKNGVKNETGDKVTMKGLGDKLSDEEITDMVAFVRSMCSK